MGLVSLIQSSVAHITVILQPVHPLLEEWASMLHRRRVANYTLVDVRQIGPQDIAFILTKKRFARVIATVTHPH